MEIPDVEVARVAASGDLFDEAYDFSARLYRTGKVIAEGLAVGAYDYGKDRVQNHLPELLLQVGTAAGLGALVVAGLAASPVVFGTFITGVAVAGTAIIVKDVGLGFRRSQPALKAVWSSPQYEDYAASEIGKNVSPILVDLAIASAAGLVGGVASGATARAVPNYYAIRPSKLKLVSVNDAASAGSNSSYISNIQAELSFLARSRLFRASVFETAVDQQTPEARSS